MNSYNFLFSHCVDPDVIRTCAIDASAHKRNRPNVKRSLRDLDETCAAVYKIAIDPDWRPKQNKASEIVDGSNGKIRTIVKPPYFPDQILHHMAVEPLKPIVMRSLYEHAYGCIPQSIKKGPRGNVYIKKYGPHTAIRQMEKWVRKGKKLYVAELDIRHAYQSVNIQILRDKLRKRIRDRQYLAFLDKFLLGMDNGLPLGFYLSPWLFNFYLLDFDHWLKRETGAQHYLRYADNLFILDPNKRKLHKTVEMLSAYLDGSLCLSLKNTRQVYRFEYKDRNGNVRGRAINALGAVIHHDRTTLRKAILHRAIKKARKIKRKTRATWHNAASMLSRLSWFRFTRCHGYFEKWILPLINIKRLKRQIRAHARAT